MKTSRLVALMSLGALVGFSPLFFRAAAQNRGTAAQVTRTANTTPGAGPVCLPPEVATRERECPAAGPALNARGSGPSSHLQTSKRREQAKKQGPQGPAFEADMSLLRGRQQAAQRQEELLAREIQLFEQNLQRRRANDPERPNWLLRLAEDRFEMTEAINARVRRLDEPIFQACEQEHNQQRCNELRQQQRQAEAALGEQRQQMIRNYAQLVQDHPEFPRMDEVLFSLGFALEEMRNFDRAREVYYRLIKNHPQSRFVPNAYLSFAEYYFADGQMRESLQFYNKVLEIPPDRNPVYGYAIYKSAWAHYNLGEGDREEFERSLESFVRTIEFATEHADARQAPELATKARRELVMPYSRVGNPQRALEFFRRYARTEDESFEMLEALGELYYDTGQWPNTIAVYHELMSSRSTSDKLCYWQSRVMNAVVSSRPKPEQVREIQRLVDTYELFTGPNGNHPPEAVTQCKQATAAVLVELSTAWHREAIGTDTQPGTNDQNTMRLASALYELVIQKFPDMEQMEFPEIDRRDWPTLYRVSYFFAELTWKMEDYEKCGPAFDRVVEIDPSGEFSSDAAYGSLLCYERRYQQQYAARERTVQTARDRQGGGGRRGSKNREPEAQADPHAEFAPTELGELENGMLRSFKRFICVAPQHEEVPKAMYRIARVNYEAHHFEEASYWFHEVVARHPDNELSEYAANLYLDSLNVLFQHGRPPDPPRLSCATKLEEGVAELLQVFCRDEAHASQHENLCAQLRALECDIKRKAAEALAAAGQYRDAAQKGVRWIRECSRNETSVGGPSPASQAPDMFWNTAIWYDAAHLVGKAIQVRKALVQTYPEHTRSRHAVYVIGANYHALAIYSNAAEYYEQFATRFPTEDGDGCTPGERSTGLCGSARTALQNATLFRIGLGEIDQAVEDAELFERNYRQRHAVEAARVMFSIGTVYESQRAWPRVVDHYRSWLRTYNRTALPDQVIRANVHIANALRQTPGANSAAQATAAYRDAVNVWERDAAERISRADGVSDSERADALYEARRATSEALFYQAEALYDAFNRIRFPEFRGTPNLENVNRWAQRDFTQWLQRKRAALEAAEAAYGRIVTIGSPCSDGHATCASFDRRPVEQWLIAAFSRVGQMYTSFVDAFDQAPVPQEIQNDPDLYEVYIGELNRNREIFFGFAIPKFEYCLTMATTLRWFNEYSVACEDYLERLDPARYRVAAELHGEATYVHRARAVPGAVQLGQQAETEEAGAP